MKAFLRTFLRLTDKIADFLREELGARAQLRIGVWFTLLSVVWTIVALWQTDEPINVLAMSGVALIATGVGIVIGAQVLERQDEDS